MVRLCGRKRTMLVEELEDTKTPNTLLTKYGVVILWPDSQSIWLLTEGVENR